MSLDEKFLEKLEYLMKNNSRKDEYQCSECRDLGYIFVQDEYGNEMAKPCKCLAKRNLQKMLDNCDLNEAFRKKNFSNYICKSPQQYRAKLSAMKYCDEGIADNKSLIICGAVGSGKTHLGVASMLYLINEGRYCRYVEYNNMMVALKQSVMDKINHEMEMEKLLNPSILFIDDFLKGSVTSVDLNYIYRIINSRYLSNKPLIISTEKSMDEIISWDEAVGSRLVEMAGGNIISFSGDKLNYRLKDYYE